MRSNPLATRLVELSGAGDPSALPESTLPFVGSLVEIGDDGTLIVRAPSGTTFECDWVSRGTDDPVRLSVGDPLLIMQAAGVQRPIVLGRIGRYEKPSLEKVPPDLRLEATGTMALRCGEASIELRADGKVLIRGEDVLVRAKGTKRIRAGTVSIN